MAISSTRRLWLRMHPERPTMKYFLLQNKVVCPICGKSLQQYVRLGSMRKRLNEIWRTNRANIDRHLDACFEKSLQKEQSNDERRES